MGSTWETIICIVKRFLYKIIVKSTLNHFELRLLTFLSSIQEAINSRPLINLSFNDESLTTLTPNFFLKFRTNFVLVFYNDSPGNDLSWALNQRSHSNLNKTYKTIHKI